MIASITELVVFGLNTTLLNEYDMTVYVVIHNKDKYVNQMIPIASQKTVLLNPIPYHFTQVT